MRTNGNRGLTSTAITFRPSGPIRRAPARGKSEGKVFRAKVWFLRGLRANTLPRHPWGMIFQNELARKSAAPIVRSCEDRKPWFSRWKTSRIGACHPGASILQMKGSRRHAVGSRQKDRSQESTATTPHSTFHTPHSWFFVCLASLRASVSPW